MDTLSKRGMLKAFAGVGAAAAIGGVAGQHATRGGGVPIPGYGSLGGLDYGAKEACQTVGREGPDLAYQAWHKARRLLEKKRLSPDVKMIRLETVRSVSPAFRRAQIIGYHQEGNFLERALRKQFGVGINLPFEDDDD